MQEVVVVGGSLAGVHSAEALRAEGFGGTVRVIGDEPPYDRPPLSKEILAGEMTPKDLSLRAAADLDVEWIAGTATGLDPVASQVRLDDGRLIRYDGLVIASGSAPRRLAGLEPDGNRVLELRTVEDAVRLGEALAMASRILIIGCGFIGVEIASAALARKVEPIMVSLDPPMIKVGSLISDRAEAILREHGVELLIGRSVASLERGGRSCRVVLDDGQQLVIDVVVVAVGAVPVTAWLRGSGIALTDGVECDQCLRVQGADQIVAAGDVARWPNPAYGGEAMRIEHWSNAIDQGRAAARTLLAGKSAEPFASVPTFWSDHFGVKLQSVGLPGGADRFEVVAGDLESGRFAAAAYRDGCLVGGVTYGIPRALARIRSQILSGATKKTEA